jgi:predicted DNA-binding transcriptional regulator YafY
LSNLTFYLKSLFEEYARQPYYLREKTFFYENFLVLQEAISHNQMVKITLSSNQITYIKPYRIANDSMNLFNYIVCFTNADTNFAHPATYRISRIQKAKIIFSQSGKITKQEAITLENEISKKGYQFVGGVQALVKLRLSEKGIKRYKSNLFLRPNYIDKKGDIYTFDAPVNQILFYFFKFVSDCEILEPKELRDKFMCDYLEGYTKYKNSNNLKKKAITKK